MARGGEGAGAWEWATFAIRMELIAPEGDARALGEISRLVGDRSRRWSTTASSWGRNGSVHERVRAAVVLTISLGGSIVALEAGSCPACGRSSRRGSDLLPERATDLERHPTSAPG